MNTIDTPLNTIPCTQAIIAAAVEDSLLAFLGMAVTHENEQFLRTVTDKMFSTNRLAVELPSKYSHEPEVKAVETLGLVTVATLASGQLFVSPTQKLLGKLAVNLDMPYPCKGTVPSLPTATAAHLRPTVRSRQPA